jgi:tRNA-dihydrouridine synthase B
MEGVTDCAFRRLCFRNGAGFTWTEMVRARGVVKRNRSTLDLVDTMDPGTPTGIQLFATNERELAQALRTLDGLAEDDRPHLRSITAVDLNLGCPSPDVIRLGAGPALLKRRGKLRLLFQALRAWQAVTSLPVGAVGAKIRLGLNQREQDHKVFLPVVELASELLDYVVVHARHAGQRSTDPPTWSAIGEAKAAARIPVIGNGDVFTPADARRMRDQTGCDGVMVARAAMRDPWCFRGMDGGPPTLPTEDEVRAAWATYRADAERWGSKEKYRAFHEQGFARLAETARRHRGAGPGPRGG